MLKGQAFGEAVKLARCADLRAASRLEYVGRLSMLRRSGVPAGPRGGPEWRHCGLRPDRLAGARGAGSEQHRCPPEDAGHRERRRGAGAHSSRSRSSWSRRAGCTMACVDVRPCTGVRRGGQARYRHPAFSAGAVGGGRRRLHARRRAARQLRSSSRHVAVAAERGTDRQGARCAPPVVREPDRRRDQDAGDADGAAARCKAGAVWANLRAAGADRIGVQTAGADAVREEATPVAGADGDASIAKLRGSHRSDRPTPPTPC